MGLLNLCKARFVYRFITHLFWAVILSWGTIILLPKNVIPMKEILLGDIVAVHLQLLQYFYKWRMLMQTLHEELTVNM